MTNHMRVRELYRMLHDICYEPIAGRPLRIQQARERLKEMGFPSILSQLMDEDIAAAQAVNQPKDWTHLL